MVLPLLLLALMPIAFGQSVREQNLEQLLRVLTPSRTPADGRINSHDKTWEDWIRRTGELPPDFDAMPSIPGLPDPLMTERGPVKSPDEWAEQRKRLMGLVEQWMFGRFPPKPDNLRATVTASRREGRVTIREVTLAFGPQQHATLRIELVIPDGAGPFRLCVSRLAFESMPG